MTCLRAALVLVACGYWAAECAAQEITPRLFWPTPKGTQVLVSGYSYSNGDVQIDPSAPIEGANSTINTGILAYTRTLDLWGRTSNILVKLPYSWGHSQALVAGVPERRNFDAFGDVTMALNVNLRGAPSMNREQFLEFRANPRPILGASVELVMPTGQYDPAYVVNVGANRWAARFKLGGVMIIERTWLLELSASTWLFGDNNDFIYGPKKQDPVYALESNLIKRIRPGLWASLDMTYFRGGRGSIDGQRLDNYQSNLKLGGTLMLPFLKRHAIKIGYANGIYTRLGNDFNQVLLSYQFILD